MRSLARVLAPAVILFSTSVSAGQATFVSGTVTYRERIALAPTAVVEIRLDDVTRAGGVPPVVAFTRLDNPSQVPLRFTLPYDASAIDPRRRYAVRASISDGGVLLFTSLDTTLVLTQGHGARANLVLTRVAGAKAPEPPAQEPPAPPLPPLPFTNLPATFTGTLPCADCDGIRYHLNLFPDDSFFLRMTYAGKAGASADDIGSWALSSDRRVLVLKGRGEESQFFAVRSPGVLRKLDRDGRPIAGPTPQDLTRASVYRSVDARLPMRGVYTYMADAASFVECSTGQRWPVAGEAAARDLESAYLKAGPAAGATVLVEIEGAVLARPRREGRGTEPTLVVDKVGRLLPRESCAPRFTSAPLADSDWRLTHLGDNAVPAADPKRELSLTFQAPTDMAAGAYSGSTGCNRLVGTYTVDNATITLTSGGTMMACKDAAATEAAFIAALKAARTYRIAGRVLELMDAKGVRLARFEARTARGITVR